MLMNLASILLTILSCWSFTACIMNAQTPLDDRTNSVATALVYTNANTTIKTQLGAVFAVRLASNPTTGYQWRLERLLDGAPVTLRTHRYEAPQDSRRLGAGGHEYWEFQAVSAGSETLHLVYLRPWEPDNFHTQVLFTVTVD